MIILEEFINGILLAIVTVTVVIVAIYIILDALEKI